MTQAQNLVNLSEQVTCDTSGNVSTPGSVTAGGALTVTGAITAANVTATTNLKAQNINLQAPTVPTLYFNYGAGAGTTGPHIAYDSVNDVFGFINKAGSAWNISCNDAGNTTIRGTLSSGAATVGALTSGAHTVNGTLTVSGVGTFQSQPVIAFPAATMVLNGTAGNYRGIYWQSSGVYRWAVGANQTAESSNSGSDFSIDRWNDSGTWLDSPLTISRSNGQVNIKNILQVSGAQYVGNTSSGAQMSPAFYLASQGYVVYMRANNGIPAFEMVNSANTAVNFTVADNGNITARGNVQSAVVGTGTGVFVTNGDIGTSWNAWQNQTAAYSVSCPNYQSAYIGIRWTRWGGRHLAMIGGYEGGTTSSAPIVGFLIGSDTSPNFQFYQGGVGTYAGSWTQASDYRLKDKVKNVVVKDALKAIMALRPVTFIRKDQENKIRRTGLLAHEAAESVPELVYGEKDAMQPNVDGKAEPAYQSLDYIGLVPYLVSIIQAQELRLAKLEAMVAKLVNN